MICLVWHLDFSLFFCKASPDVVSMRCFVLSDTVLQKKVADHLGNIVATYMLQYHTYFMLLQYMAQIVFCRLALMSSGSVC